MTVRLLLRKALWTLGIVFGVILVTFLLFNLAAGDPAAAMLGKSASPREIEAMRHRLGSDRPLFFGRDCPTLAFGADPDRAGRWRRNFPTDFPVVAISGSGRRTELRSADTAFVPDTPGPVTFVRRQDSPWNSQFASALGDVVRFHKTFPFVEFLDFGETLATREPIRALLWRGLGPSLALMLPIFFGELILGIALALAAAVWRDRWPDRVLVFLSVLGMSVSLLAAIIFAQWFLAYRFDWFPVWGWGSAAYLALPVLIGIACGLGGSVRFYRTVLIDELGKEYLRTAAAKGCAPLAVYGKHLLRASLLPIIGRASAALPFLFTGSLLLESFFGIPGLGYAAVEALMNADLQLLKALVTVGALLFAGMNLLTDLAYAWADPRLR